MSGDLLVKDVRPMGGSVTDVRVRDGRIEALGQRLEAPGDAATVVEGRGELLLPGFVDAHAHLDKTLWGLPWRPHSGGPTLAELIRNERRHRRELPPVAQRAGNLLAAYVAAGVTHIRSHVDVDPEAGLASIEGVLEARERFRDRVTVEIVAFPQSGMLVEPGTRELLEAAVEAGAECVGGLDPAGVDGDPVEHLDAIFGIAARHGAGVDIHLHDCGELGAWEVRLIVERTRALGLAGRVMISHAFCLSIVADGVFDELARDLAEQRIAVATAASPRGEPLPLRRLRDAGVAVCLGQDGIRDLWSPYGTGDMLERAMLLAWRSSFRRDEDVELALETATIGGARALGLEGYGLDVGCHADLVVLPGEGLAEAVVSRPPRSLVVKRGRIVAGRRASTVA
ncbi:MAG: amidohydrolase family protein [Chloroflexi bacterium]|nr:amidohydrolase family protein [Chloroflexota bacterium]